MMNVVNCCNWLAKYILLSLLLRFSGSEQPSHLRLHVEGFIVVVVVVAAVLYVLFFPHDVSEFTCAVSVQFA